MTEPKEAYHKKCKFAERLDTVIAEAREDYPSYHLEVSEGGLLMIGEERGLEPDGNMTYVCMSCLETINEDQIIFLTEDELEPEKVTA